MVLAGSFTIIVGLGMIGQWIFSYLGDQQPGSMQTILKESSR